MLHFRCLGIPVRVEPFFWATMGILGALVSSSQVGDNSPYTLLLIALFMVAGFISILVHELGHALTARHFGAKVSIVLEAFGGYAKMSGRSITRKQSIAITAAGPLLQILLGAVVLGIAKLLPKVQPGAELFLIWLIGISFIWALFNLLPILPMDGGRILQTALGQKRIRTTLWISMITCAVMTVVGLQFGYFFIAILFGVYGWQAWQALQRIKPR